MDMESPSLGERRCTDLEDRLMAEGYCICKRAFSYLGQGNKMSRGFNRQKT